MAVKTRSELNADNAALFVNNTTGNITPALEKAFNENVNDSFVNRNGDTFEAGAEFVFDNGSKLKEGTDGGIALECAVGYDFQWKEGVQYYRPIGGSISYANSSLDINPDEFFDNTKFYAVGSKYKNLVTGIEYVCTDATTDNAVWQAQSGDITDTALGLSFTGDWAASAFNNAKFERVGDFCHIYLNIDLSFAGLSTGTVTIATLPIATATTLSSFNIIGFKSFQSIPLLALGVLIQDFAFISDGANLKFRADTTGSVVGPDKTSLHFIYPIS